MCSPFLERGLCTWESLWEKQRWSKARREGEGVGRGDQGTEEEKPRLCSSGACGPQDKRPWEA